MDISYDVFVGAFLSKISEFDFLELVDEDRNAIVDGYLKRAMTLFKKNCKYDFISKMDDESRAFIFEEDEDGKLLVDTPSDEEIDEIVNIVSEGMVAQWMKPYVYRQENLENVLNSKDFTAYSPAELLMRISNAYTKVQKDYTQMIREYSYNYGSLTELHI